MLEDVVSGINYYALRHGGRMPTHWTISTLGGWLSLEAEVDAMRRFLNEPSGLRTIFDGRPAIPVCGVAVVPP